MIRNNSIVLLLFLLIELTRSHSYYLIDIDMNFSSCSNILINKTRYGIPRLCQKHLLCHPSHCDDQSFRCVKIRETLCCLSQYIDKICSKDRTYKDRFRSIYFHISIEHGYCEINLERIEQNDPLYCLTNQFHTPTMMSVTRQILEKPTNFTSTSSVLQINSIVLILIILILNK